MEKLSTVDGTIAGRRLPLRRVQLICEDPTLTKTSFTHASDIRTIISRANKTGVLEVNSRTPQYGDFTSLTPEGFQESLNKVTEIKQQFALLGAKIRERFHNDPVKILSFLSDPANDPEAIALGLKPAPKETKTPASLEAEKNAKPEHKPQA